MGLPKVWLTPGVAVNFRFFARMRRDVQEGIPNRTPSTA
jgi:hypothetical protein